MSFAVAVLLQGCQGVVMKKEILALLLNGWVVTSTGSELPVAVVDGLVIEEAWVRAQPGGAEIYLVINNRNITAVGPVQIDVPGAAATRVTRSDGKDFEPTLPPHAELYMQPDGVRVEALGLSVAESVPVRVSLGEAEIVVNATVLGIEDPLPDHHDYVHS